MRLATRKRILYICIYLYIYELCIYVYIYIYNEFYIYVYIYIYMAAIRTRLTQDAREAKAAAVTQDANVSKNVDRPVKMWAIFGGE